MAWRLSNTLEAGFCAEASKEARTRGRTEVFNTDPGSESIRVEFTLAFQDSVMKISMDGKGRYNRQHLRGAAIADDEVRVGVPEMLPQRHRGTE